MKKHIIAAAVAAAVAVPAMAQNVTVYGRLDAGYQRLDVTGVASGTLASTVTGTTVGKTSGLAYGSDQTSLWGLRGTEDLGGGMKANFVIETGFNGAANTAFSGLGKSSGNTTGQTASPATDLAASQVGNRLLYASLGFASGTEVRVGYQSSMARDVYIATAADSATNITGNIVGYLYGTRHNAVSVFQNVGAVKLGAAVTNSVTNTNGAGAADVNTGSGYALTAIYGAGPVSASAAYMTNKNGSDTAAANSDRTSIVAGASYDFGTARAFIQYADFKNEVAAGDGKTKGYNVGVRVPAGAASLFVSYSDGSNQQAGSTTKNDIRGYNLGARYNLSKRTNVYAIYGKLDLDVTSNTKSEVKNLGIGVVHSF